MRFAKSATLSMSVKELEREVENLTTTAKLRRLEIAKSKDKAAAR